MTDESGGLIAGQWVELDYPGSGAGPASTPESHCQPRGVGCWLHAVTDSDGRYQATFWADVWSMTPGPGFVYAYRDGSQVDVQPLSATTTDIVQNLTLRRLRMVRVGETLSVDVEPESAACTDLEDWWLLDHRCVTLTIDTPSTGTLRVEARSPAGDAAPVLFFATSGNYSGQRLVTPGVLEAAILGGQYHVFVGVPQGSPTARFDVTVSLR